MARTNRLSVYDGVYHVTARVANRALLFKPDEVKDHIVDTLIGTAAFSGVELYSWSIMENHLHILVHVPPVPESYWLDPTFEPAAHCNGIRPPQIRESLWSPTLNGDRPSPLTPVDGDRPLTLNGDRPSPLTPVDGDRPLMMDAALPPVAFTLPDDEMLTRLRSIYSEQTVDAIAKRWKDMRARGLGSVVDERKERYCRRMYNVSQFAKTLKESLSRWYNATYDHTGCLWEGRFYSSLVERTSDVLAIVSAYIAYNPVKAGIAATPADWRWSSYAKAVRGANAVDLECRRLYERMLNRSWDEVRDMLEAIYADKLPEDVRPDDVCASFDDYDEDVATERPLAPRSLRASQVIRVTLKCFARGAYLSADFDWLKSVKAALPPRFPAAGSRSVKRCRAFLWHLPDHARRAA